ncbi:MAG: hypothetical protein WC726_01065 [Parcubacteria group bacterium]|jgi:hypothetical protein
MKLKLIALTLLLIPVLTLAQDVPKKKAYYFFGEQCPHCKIVDEYFQANGVYDKYDITKLEVVSNPFNAKLFVQFGEAFGVKDWGGVPAIVFGSKYLLGDQPIIDNFAREIDAAENANELTDPDKIVQKSASENQNDSNVPAVAAGEGNKKSYFPVVIGALVVLGAGALVYINRKKQ